MRNTLPNHLGPLLIFASLTTAFPWAVAQDADTVEVHAYINTGALNRIPEGSNPERLAEVNAYIAEQTGVEIIPSLPPGGSAAVEKLNLMLSSPNERLDVFQASWTEYAPIALPLNDLLDQHGQNILKAWPEESWAKVTDADGNIMAIPRFAPSAVYPVWVRTDLLEALDLSMPTTVDELETFLEAYKAQDPQGIPLLGNLGGLQMALLGAFTEYGNSNWLDPEDNRLKPAVLQPGYEDWVAKMADWYAKGYIYPDTLGVSDTGQLRDVVGGQKVGAGATWYSVFTLALPALQEVNPEIDYEFTNLTGPEGQAQTLAAPASSGIIISQRAPSPEAIIRFIDWQYENPPTNNLTAFYGIEGKDWEYVEEAEGAEDLVPGTRLVQVEAPQTTGYAGELNWSFGQPLEAEYVNVIDGKVDKHSQYLNCCIADLSAGKLPVDAAVAYEESEIQQVFPNQQDFDRYLEEGLTLFINGARPMSDWPAFLEEMERVGLEQWIEAYTAAFNVQQEQ